MRELSGKRLLILGANPETAALVTVAKDMGVYTIVTDYDPKAYAKAFADKSYNVDAIDVDSLVILAKEERVDGVLVGVADALIPTYQKVCERIGVPCYATEEQVKVFTNKNFFKRKCEEYGILGVPEYRADEKKENITYPVIVKPTDSNSGKGITLCDTSEELEEAIETAKQASASNTYLLEEYMECEDVSIYYTLKDGKAYLSSMSDRYTYREQRKVSPVCLGDIFPSKVLDIFMKEEHPKFCKMFNELGIKNGIFYTSAFYRDGKFYVYDPGFRLQGGGFHLILKAAHGFDHREMLINYALTGDMGEPKFESLNDPYLSGKAAAVIWFLLKPGVIAKIDGIDYVKTHPDVIHFVQRFQEGDVIPESAAGTERQVFLRIFVLCNSDAGLRRTIKDLQNKVKVFDDCNNLMMLKGIDADEVIGKNENEREDS
ncbi:MAG: ATP-grasp domain-containing protein [Lachnospiraceae bacterium]|nr:ATP-grasp domain-containing protein [Lachnospiraceae bacterium]